jgi:hypothetical protein
VKGMLQDPRRHFVARRAAEVDNLAGAPKELRRTEYMKNLNSAVERASRAAAIEPALRMHSTRLEGWHRGLAEQMVSDRHNRDVGYARAPNGRRYQRPNLLPEDPDGKRAAIVVPRDSSRA